MTHSQSAMTRAHVCHVTWVPWLIHMCAMTHWHVRHDSFTRMPWLIHTCAMTHSYGCQNSSIHTHTHTHTHSNLPNVQHVPHDSFICVPWLMHMCAKTHSHVCHDSIMWVSWLIHTHTPKHTHTHSDLPNVQHVPHPSQSTGRNSQNHVSKVSSLLNFHDTGWRRLIGCLKSQVIVCKRATNYRALLQKMTYKDKASYESSPHCTITTELTLMTFYQLTIHHHKKTLKIRAYSNFM